MFPGIRARWYRLDSNKVPVFRSCQLNLESGFKYFIKLALPEYKQSTRQQWNFHIIFPLFVPFTARSIYFPCKHIFMCFAQQWKLTLPEWVYFKHVSRCFRMHRKELANNHIKEENWGRFEICRTNWAQWLHRKHEGF